MADFALHNSTSTHPSSLKLDTLIRVRWLAVMGQSAAIIITAFYLNFPLPFAECFLVVALSAWLNLGLRIRFPFNQRLSGKQAALLLAWDELQLAGLLFLTGGIQNPFLFLFLVPVLVSASSLPLKWTVSLAALVTLLSILLSFFALPLPWIEGEEIALPPLYEFSLWVAFNATLLFAIIYARQVATETQKRQNALMAAELVLAREQHLSALDGLAAAAAHELGTPLGTIALVVRELDMALSKDDPNKEDLALLSSQVARCRTILGKLTTMTSEEGSPFTLLSLEQLFGEITSPYEEGATRLLQRFEGDGEPPVLARNAAMLYGLGNFVENAVDYARTTVTLKARWTETSLEIVVEDDGPGFEPDVLEHLGEPYLTSRNEDEGASPAGGLGLGFFIAKTLLERTGAEIFASNRKNPSGAIVRIVWERNNTALFR